MYRKIIKRCVDIIIALIALVIALPFLFVATLVLGIANNGKPFFFQKRPGKHGRVFTIIKFKTMNDKKDASGNLLPDGERITWIGRVIRKTSMDEIPQMLNVLKGEMSLIGPRPLLVEYLPLYSEEQARRHNVRPGVTGWAQVNGRNAISWEKRFELDVWYVDHISFMIDMKILFLTVKKVFISEGVSAPNSATMEKFKGSSV